MTVTLWFLWVLIALLAVDSLADWLNSFDYLLCGEKNLAVYRLVACLVKIILVGMALNLILQPR